MGVEKSAQFDKSPKKNFQQSTSPGDCVLEFQQHHLKQHTMRAAAPLAAGMHISMTSPKSCPSLDRQHTNSMFVCEVTGNHTNMLPVLHFLGDQRLPNGNRKIIASAKDCAADSKGVEEAAECIKWWKDAVRKSPTLPFPALFAYTRRI